MNDTIKFDVFRGNDEPFRPFDQFDKGAIGRVADANTVGFWFSDSTHAVQYYGENVKKFKIKFKNPLYVCGVDFTKGAPKGPSYWAQEAYNRNLDGVIISSIIDGDRESTVFCVFHTGQIEFK